MIVNGPKTRQQVLALLARKDYRPLNKIDIARELGLTGAQRNALRKTLRELERAGAIVRIRKDRYVLPAEAELVTGKLSIHQVGYGFLAPETPGQPDIFIAAENTGTAMHRDRVVVDDIAVVVDEASAVTLDLDLLDIAQLVLLAGVSRGGCFNSWPEVGAQVLQPGVVDDGYNRSPG